MHAIQSGFFSGIFVYKRTDMKICWLLCSQWQTYESENQGLSCESPSDHPTNPKLKISVRCVWCSGYCSPNDINKFCLANSQHQILKEHESQCKRDIFLYSDLIFIHFHFLYIFLWMKLISDKISRDSIFFCSYVRALCALPIGNIKISSINVPHLV